MAIDRQERREKRWPPAAGMRARAPRTWRRTGRRTGPLPVRECDREGGEGLSLKGLSLSTTTDSNVPPGGRPPSVFFSPVDRASVGVAVRSTHQSLPRVWASRNLVNPCAASSIPAPLPATLLAAVVQLPVVQLRQARLRCRSHRLLEESVRARLDNAQRRVGPRRLELVSSTGRADDVVTTMDNGTWYGGERGA